MSDWKRAVALFMAALAVWPSQAASTPGAPIPAGSGAKIPAPGVSIPAISIPVQSTPTSGALLEKTGSGMIPRVKTADPQQQHGISSRPLPPAFGGVSTLMLPAELYGAVYFGQDGVADLYRIDPSTGSGTFIGSTGFQRVSAMDFDGSGRLLAVAERDDGTDTSVLISINLGTGAGTEIGPTGVVATGFGDTVSDISFRQDGRLYAYIEPYDGLGVIDPATGTITAIGSTGLISADAGLAFNNDGLLCHADESRLRTLDQTTGAPTDVGPLQWPPEAGSFPRVNAMDANPVTQALWASVQDGSGTQSTLAGILPDGSFLFVLPAPAGLNALAWRLPRPAPTLPPLAPVLYGAAYTGPDGPATLYRIDPATGRAAFIGPIGFKRVSGMDFDAYGNLYATGMRNDATQTSVLISIDIRTGQGTEIAPTGLLFETFSDIDFRRGDGRLYGYVEPFDNVATINPANGSVTVLGPSAAPGCCGNGIAFDTAGATLYHANDAYLGAIDQATGQAGQLAPLSWPPQLTSSPRINGMDVHPSTGEIFVSIRHNASPNSYLGRLDPLTGAISPIGPSVSGLDAIAWGGVTCGVVDFEGIPDQTRVGKVGGAVSVSFGSEWIVLRDTDAGGDALIANEPSPDTIAFHEDPPAPIELGSGVRFVRLWMLADPNTVPIEFYGYDEPGGTGNLVSFDVRSTAGLAPPAPCTGDPTGDYCLWDALTLTSTTDNIRSLVIYGSSPRWVAYDDLTWCQGPPDLLYGTSFNGPDGLATLHRIDPETGSGVAVGPIGFQRVSAMDFDPNGVLYATGERNDGTDTDVLLRIDTATGSGTEVAPVMVWRAGFGDVVADMSFRSDGALFGFVANGDGLVRIDTTSGFPVALGPVGVDGSAGIAFDRYDRLLHAAPASRNELDQTNGAATFLGSMIWPPPADTDPRVNAMDLHPRTGIPWLSINDGQGAGAPENYLGTLSQVTGAVRIIGSTVPRLDALAWLTTAMPGLPPEVSPPGAVIPLSVSAPNPMQLVVSWEPTILADTYRMMMGEFAVLRPMTGVVPGNAGSARCGIDSTTAILPMPQGNVFILVAADNTAGTGPLGNASPSMRERLGDLICP